MVERSCAARRWTPEAGLAAALHAVAVSGAHLHPHPTAFTQIRELARGDPRAWCSLRRLHLPERALKHRKARVATRYPQHPTPGVADDARGLEHHLLHHRLDATAQRRLSQWTVTLVQRVLPHDAQQVHRHRCERAHQVVGGELARG